MNVPIVSKLPPARLSFRKTPLFPGTKAVLTTNGRTAISLGLKTLSMPAGAVVLMPDWHCGSEIDAVISAGGRPVLYPLDQALNADLDALSALVQQHQPWAIYCIHYFGYPQPLSELAGLAKRHGAVLIEDLALGLLSQGGTSPIGRTGDMTIYSLVKTLAVPDGGALWLRDKPVANRLKAQSVLSSLRGARRMVRRLKPVRGMLTDKFATTPEAALDAWDQRAGFTKGRPLLAASGLSATLCTHMPLADIRAAHRQNYQKLWLALVAADAAPRARPLLPELPLEACPAYFPALVSDPADATAALAAAGIESVLFWRRFLPDFGPEIGDRPVHLKRHVLRLPIHPAIDASALSRMVAALVGPKAK